MPQVKKGAGLKRDCLGVKRWMSENGITNKQVARDVGVNPNSVSATIRGVGNNRKTLGRLLELGCPADILSLPLPKGHNKVIWGQKKGAGQGRDYYGLKRWMGENGVTNIQIAKDVGCNRASVTPVLRGYSNDRKILRRFLELGCPADILSPPADMMAADA